MKQTWLKEVSHKTKIVKQLLHPGLMKMIRNDIKQRFNQQLPKIIQNQLKSKFNSPVPKKCFFLNEGSLKMMKDAFYFI